MHKLMSGRHAVLFCTVAALFAMAAAAHADMITIANTGVGSGRDANYLYTVTTDPTISPGVLAAPNDTNGVFAAYILDTSAWPIGQGGPYNKSTGSGKWIGPQPQYYGGHLTSPTSEYFVYQTSFTIASNIDLSTVLITGDLSSDNCTTSLAINGVGLGGTLMPSPGCSTDGDSMKNAHVFEIGGSNANFGSTTGIYFAYAAFHTGINTIQFKVYNDNGAQPNPTGLVVWAMQAQGSETPEPSTAGLVIAGIAGVAWLRRKATKCASSRMR